MAARITHYKNMFVTAMGTMGSRILGLVRDQLLFGLLGNGAVASAVLYALQIPNLFRRLLGEGALTAALVPVMTDGYNKGGKPQAFRLLNTVLTRASILMLVLTLIGIVSALAAAWFIDGNAAIEPDALIGKFDADTESLTAQLVGGNTDLEPRFRFAAQLTALCMPYMPLVCLAAIFTAALNILGRFGVTSLSAVLLNISMIVAMGASWLFISHDEPVIAVCLCFGAISGGLLQLLTPAWALWHQGWRPRFSLEHSPEWERLRSIFLPAVAGAGIQQINFLFTRSLAVGVDASGLGSYHLANRIVELPIGVFSMTVATVIFPLLAMHATRKESREMGETFSRGMRLIFAVNIPAAVGLIVLAEPVVRVLFEHGKFTANDTAQALPVLVIFAVAMPFYGIIALVGRGFNSLNDTRTPAKMALWVFLVNIVLSPVLGWLFKAPGLAAANLVAAVFQYVVLWKILRGKNSAFCAESFWKPLVQCLAAAVVMGGCVHVAWRFCDLWHPVDGAANLAVDALKLAAVIGIGTAVYFFILWILRYPELSFLLAKRRKDSGTPVS